MRRFLIAAAAAALLCPAGRAAGEQAAYRSGVIREDTVWSGTVTLVGPTVVKKGATLTIRPGTKVLFAWVDEDGDGIGDGELNVEGRLIARGTPEELITFTSGRRDPRPRDWTYLMLSTSRDFVVQHCHFEYAFTGLQAHFSSGIVADCIFRNNFEGLRFSTADLTVRNNLIEGNTYGIRYESRGSETIVTANDIRDNEYGFFPVIKSTSTVTIEGNNITSRSYNVKLGERQGEDLDFRRNWWGSIDPAEIESRIFDQRREPQLGRVIYDPFLARPVEGAGRRKENK